MSQPTPASEKSVYFDAPLMHIRTEKTKPASARSSISADPDASRSMNGMGSVRGTDVNRQPSVAISRNPVIQSQPRDAEEDNDDDDGDAGVDTSEDGRDSRARRKRASISGFSYTSGTGTIPSASVSRRAKSVPRPRSPTSAVESSVDSVGRTSTRVGGGGGTLRKRASVRSGAFSTGPGTIGPEVSAEHDLIMHTRERTAESILSPKQKSKITKEELKQGKRLSKIIQTEQKAEKQALEISMKELAELTKLQKTAMKDESRAHTAHATTLKSYHKTELAYLSAQAKYESAITDLKNAEEGLEKSREHAAMVTEMVREKMQEVEDLRGMKRVDDRERMAKVAELKGKVANGE